MKFECPQCGKKYSLPDEKVPTGKDFKVKCKKCGEVIILHGGRQDVAAQPPVEQHAVAHAPAPEAQEGSPFSQGEAAQSFEEEPTRVFDYSKVEGGDYPDQAALGQDFQAALPGQEQAVPAEAPPGAYGEEPEWHIAVEGEQMGPYLGSQIGEMLAAQQIDVETYLWRDGFEDWIPLKDVPDFQDLMQQQAAGTLPDQMQAADAGIGGHQAQPQGGGSLFSEAFSAAGGAAQPQAQQAARTRSHDLFSPQAADDADASPFEAGAGQDVVTSSPMIPEAPRIEASQLKGARHDDSVLFSLGSLQALASSSKEPARAVTTSEGGSGLIDIRSLAGEAAAGPSSSAKTDDIFSMGGGGFGQAMGIPTLLQPQEKKSNVLLYVLGGVGGFALVAIIVLVIGIFGLGWGQGPDEDAGPKQTLNEEELKAKLLAELKSQGALSGSPAENKSGQEAASSAAAEGSEQEGQEGKGEEGSGDDSKPRTGKSKKRKGSSSSSSPEDILAVKKDKEPGTKTGSAKGDDLLILIDQATSSSKKKSSSSSSSSSSSAKSSPPAASLPSTPSKGDVLKAMKAVTAKVKRCAKGQTGKAVTSIIFSGSTGRATSAKVIGGEFKGTAAAGCIANAAKSAKVPKFKQPKFVVTYPFVIK